jgi:predicted ABC-type ATPase
MFKPLVLVFAGPNGSGKSILTKQMRIYGTYVNADDIKKEYHFSDLEAAQKATELRNNLVDAKEDFTFETVLSTERNLCLLQKAKENGFEIQCVYILTCNTDINVARVRSRVAAGGHDVPEDKIRSRYVKSLKMLPQLIDICDEILVYDNSVEPELIFRKDEKGTEYSPTKHWSLEKLKTLIQGI